MFTYMSILIGSHLILYILNSTINCNCSFIYLNYILLIMLLQFSQLSPFTPLPPVLPNPPAPHLSSCPWVVLTSSLTSLFPIPFLTSPHLFYAYQLCFFFPVPFSPIPPFSLPTEISPCDVHFSDSVPLLVVCLVFVFIVFLFFLVHLLIVVSLELPALPSD